jgi:undecaprenyl-diphosphatase
VAIALSALALGALGLIAARSSVGEVEREVFRAVNELGPGWWLVLFPIMQAGTLLAGPVAAVVALLARRRLLAVELLVGGTAAWLVARVLKLVVSRPRPAFLVEAVVVRGGEIDGLGYPSGHVTVAMTLATILAAWLPGRWEWIFWVTVVAVGVGRMYVGAHLPLDVLGGVLLGGIIGAGIRALAHTRRLQPVVEAVEG